jgi:hypothetical protein
MPSNSLGWKDYHAETWQLHVLTESDEHHYPDDKPSLIKPTWIEQSDGAASG